MKTIYPTGLAYIPGVPAVEQEVSDREARRLLKYQPPAFTLDPPDEPVATRLSLNERPPAEAVEETEAEPEGEAEDEEGEPPETPAGEQKES